MRNYFDFDSALGCRMIPKRLVFTGGGTRCLVFVDALCVLEDAGVLTRVESYWGTSAGALVATLLALSGSAKTLRDCMYNTDFVKFRDIDVNNLPTQFARFVRVPECDIPVATYEIPFFEYEWVGDVVKDVWKTRPMTEIERIEKDIQLADERLEIQSIQYNEQRGKEREVLMGNNGSAPDVII